MSQVVTFEDYRPAARYDDIPWTEAQIEEGDTSVGPWTLIDTITLDPIDTDPANPLVRSFTTELASDTLGLWYRVTFLDGAGDTSAPTFPVQQGAQETYATAAELATLLKVSETTYAASLQRVLVVATGEINNEIARSEDNPITGWELALVSEVCLERATEHWHQSRSPFGIVTLGEESGPMWTPKDSWDRHARKLAPLREKVGLA
jgi:hypothetical protein